MGAGLHWGRAAAAWLAILVLAVANGAFREAVLAPRLSPAASQLASGTLLCALIFGASLALVSWVRPGGQRQALRIGALWVVLTAIFELGFGVARGLPPAELLAPYAFRGGNLWPLILLTTFLSPAAALRLRPARP